MGGLVVGSRLRSWGSLDVVEDTIGFRLANVALPTLAIVAQSTSLAKQVLATTHSLYKRVLRGDRLDWRLAADLAHLGRRLRLLVDLIVRFLRHYIR